MMIAADSREIPLADKCVHCCITSPPYWGLRDYGLPGQLGLERTPQLYLAEMRKVFREVWRVLRDDGTAWVNMGDSYNAYNGNAGPGSGFSRGAACDTERPHLETGHGLRTAGLKPKDLCGIPWRLAFALQEDGWYLRSDIIWTKPNPMPESVTDRPTKSHEYVFLLAKQEWYFYDAEAVKQNAIAGWNGSKFTDERDLLIRPNTGVNRRSAHMEGTPRNDGDRWRTADGGVAARGKRNLRSVWNIATQPYSGAHFATFPEKLVEPCIRAGTSERGVCCQCGAPWERVTRRDNPNISNEDGIRKFEAMGLPRTTANLYATRNRGVGAGWRPTCLCPNQRGKTKRAIVLDPFGGSGTVGRVATRLNRDSLLLDIGYRDKYAPLAVERNSRVQMELV